MPISHGTHLFALIHSLTKAEKRNFRLYVRRVQGEGDAKFLQLFDLLEKQRVLDEELLRKKLGKTTKGQYSNLKRHLYQHILLSIRLLEINKREAIQVREWIDYAYILYGKGLYLQALKLLSKAKTLAQSHNLDLLHAEVIDFESKIESRHITRATTERMEYLIKEASERSKINIRIVELSNLKLYLQRLFINQGHVTDPSQSQKVQQLFEERMPVLVIEDLTFFEKAYYYQVKYWYAYLQMDFRACQVWSHKWVELYQNQDHMIEMDVDLYMRAVHHLLNATFWNNDQVTQAFYFDKITRFRDDRYKKFNTNSKILSFLVVHQARLNYYFLTGDYQKGAQVISKTLKRLKTYAGMIDDHKVLNFYYKIAWMYMGSGQAEKALDFVNKILNAPGPPLRKETYAYSHLIGLMAHYELGNYDLLDYLTERATRFLKQIEDPKVLLSSSIRFFRRLINTSPDKTDELFVEFLEEIKQLRANKYEQRAFLFLPVDDWIRRMLDRKN